jgi:GAF domain-containing protein
MSDNKHDLAEALHTALLKTLLEGVTKGIEIVDKESGMVTRIKPGASYLNVVRQFLKDNNVELTETGLKASQEDLERLIESLPEFDEDDIAMH